MFYLITILRLIQMQIEQIKVSNIRCGSCSGKIQKELSKIPGVRGVQVKLKTQTVFIKHNGKRERNLFINRLHSPGYPLEDQLTFFQKVKSLFFCAIKRTGHNLARPNKG